MCFKCMTFVFKQYKVMETQVLHNYYCNQNISNYTNDWQSFEDNGFRIKETYQRLQS